MWFPSLVLVDVEDEVTHLVTVCFRTFVSTVWV
jgi:hypothetical protein